MLLKYRKVTFLSFGEQESLTGHDRVSCVSFMSSLTSPIQSFPVSPIYLSSSINPYGRGCPQPTPWKKWGNRIISE